MSDTINMTKKAGKHLKKVLAAFLVMMCLIPGLIILFVATAVATPALYVDWLAGEVREWWGDLFPNADELSRQWYASIYPSFAPYASYTAVWLGESISMYYYLEYEDDICNEDFSMDELMLYMNPTEKVSNRVASQLIGDVAQDKGIIISDDAMTKIYAVGLEFKQRGDEFNDVVVPPPGDANDVVMKAMLWAIDVANDPRHGYSQFQRFGNPDYDCSSLMSYAFIQAGVPVPVSTTDTMQTNFTSVGFQCIPFTRSALKPGDVLLVNRGAKHTEMYIGNNQLVGAHIDESGGIAGRIPGDQTGNEISVGAYYDDGWEWILRYGS